MLQVTTFLLTIGNHSCTSIATIYYGLCVGLGHSCTSIVSTYRIMMYCIVSTSRRINRSVCIDGYKKLDCEKVYSVVNSEYKEYMKIREKKMPQSIKSVDRRIYNLHKFTVPDEPHFGLPLHQCVLYQTLPCLPTDYEYNDEWLTIVALNALGKNGEHIFGPDGKNTSLESLLSIIEQSIRNTTV